MYTFLRWSIIEENFMRQKNRNGDQEKCGKLRHEVKNYVTYEKYKFSIEFYLPVKQNSEKQLYNVDTDFPSILLSIVLFLLQQHTYL